MKGIGIEQWREMMTQKQMEEKLTIQRRNPELPSGWKYLQRGYYGDEMVSIDNKWYALIDPEPRRIFNRPMYCLIYARKHYNHKGVTETRYMVSQDHSAKLD